MTKIALDFADYKQIRLDCFISAWNWLFYGERSFPVAAACVWNELPCLVMSTPSDICVFHGRLKAHLSNCSFLNFLYCLEVTSVITGHFLLLNSVLIIRNAIYVNCWKK